MKTHLPWYHLLSSPALNVQPLSLNWILPISILTCLGLSQIKTKQKCLFRYHPTRFSCSSQLLSLPICSSTTPFGFCPISLQKCSATDFCPPKLCALFTSHFTWPMCSSGPANQGLPSPLILVPLVGFQCQQRGCNFPHLSSTCIHKHIYNS